MKRDDWAYDAHPAMFRNRPLLFTMLLVSLVGIVGIGIWWVIARGERLAVSNREVLMERGLLSKQRVQLNLSAVRSVRVTQGLMQRLFNVGDIEIFSAGDYAEIALRGMPDPDRVRELAAAVGHDDAPAR